MTHTKELLPCPFCGGTNVKVFGPYGWYRNYGISHSCRAFYSGAQELAQGFHSETDAVAAWNTRAGLNPDAVADVVAALEAIAAPAIVPLDQLPDHDQPNGWRDLATARIDRARTALARIRGEG